jgi:hypothetical protein
MVYYAQRDYLEDLEGKEVSSRKLRTAVNYFTTEKSYCRLGNTKA